MDILLARIAEDALSGHLHVKVIYKDFEGVCKECVLLVHATPGQDFLEEMAQVARLEDWLEWELQLGNPCARVKYANLIITEDGIGQWVYCISEEKMQCADPTTCRCRACSTFTVDDLVV